MREIRSAIVGCGKVGHIHAQALRDLPGSTLVAAFGLPPHAAYVLSNVARRCATEWQRVADDLEQRTRNMA